MLKIDDLPKQPEDALFVLMPAFIRLARSTPGGGPVIRMANKQNYDLMYVYFMACETAAKRINDDNFRGFAARQFEALLDKQGPEIATALNNVFQALCVVRMDEHFLSEEDENEFERAAVPTEERVAIREALETARQLTATARFLEDKQKRSVLHKISKAESELFKDKVGFSAFMAAAYEVSGLVKQFGKDAEPLAEAIQTATTKTERHLSGYEALEAPKKPKQIEGPKGEE
ncbi:hypothetical protein [Yoonia sp. R78084]|uniref:hypothetical protein n=1 Tax=Yoonia sp. R78084 TaxID=3093869 RepID=UPI0037DDD7BC